jgi:glycosyltransferase involved in cell wall biosynthesis
MGVTAAKPLVSVIVPAFNAEATLFETLRSVQAQTYANIEILIVDDGSKDDTRNIAAEFCKGEPRARLLTKNNGGVASARNFGIAEAKGDWVAPVDADDLWHPTKIEKQLAAALAAPELPGFVYCWYHNIDDEGKVISSGPRWRIEGHALRELAYCNPVQNGSALLLLRDAVVKVGGYDPALRDCGSEGCEDVMIQLRIAQHYPVAIVSEHLVGYRKHSSSMSSNNEQIIRSWRLVYQRLAAAGFNFSPRLMQWNEGFFKMALAQNFAARRRYGEALSHLASGVRLDPVRWMTYVFYRLARTSLRLLRGRRPRPTRVPFAEVDPHSFIEPDPDAIRSLERLVTAIDLKRLEGLAKVQR